MQERVHIVRRDAAHRVGLRDESLVRHVHRDLDDGLGGTLAVAGLEHPQLAALDGELHILHVCVMLLEA